MTYLLNDQFRTENLSCIHDRKNPVNYNGLIALTQNVLLIQISSAEIPNISNLFKNRLGLNTRDKKGSSFCLQFHKICVNSKSLYVL